MINIFYRISDGGYVKEKPSYVNNENCLDNFTRVFGNSNLTIIADNVSDETFDGYLNHYGDEIIRTKFGNGAESFNYSLDKALDLNDDSVVYFVEDDYIHRQNSPMVLLEGISLGADYVTLYDHPDKFIDGINPHVNDGGEETKVFLTKSCHWKLTNSTTMTFASTVKVLKDDEKIIRKWTTGKHPNDFEMFIELRNKGKSLISPLPGYSTHGETNFLSPLVDWERVQDEIS
tara:strand:+ start:1074 stop:1769 length:696 start_codon:yes stop_codon:yes gene_type:complete